MARTKRIRREERITEVVDNVPAQPISSMRSKDYLKENIVPFTKHKKHIGPNQPEQLVFCNVSYDFNTISDDQDSLASRQNSVEASPNKSPVKYDSSPIDYKFNDLTKSNILEENFSKLLAEPKNSAQRNPRQGSLVGWNGKHPGEERYRYRQRSLPLQESTTSQYSSLLKKSLKKILVVENPFNNSSYGHSPTNRSNKSSLSFLNEESRVTNKQDNVIKQDFENFFNNSIRVKKIMHEKKLPRRDFNNSKKPHTRTKTPLLALDKEKVGSFLLPPVNKSVNYSKPDAKTELKYKSMFKQSLMAIANTPKIARDNSFNEETIRMSDFLPPSKANTPFERRKLSTQGTSTINNPIVKEHNKRYDDSPARLLQSLERYRDFVVKMREPEPNDASTINVLSISESIQAKKLGLANGREIKGSRGGNGNAKPQMNKANKIRNERIKVQEPPPKDLQVRRLVSHGVNNQRDKIREAVQKEVFEKYKKTLM